MNDGILISTGLSHLFQIGDVAMDMSHVLHKRRSLAEAGQDVAGGQEFSEYVPSDLAAAARNQNVHLTM